MAKTYLKTHFCLYFLQKSFFKYLQLPLARLKAFFINFKKGLKYLTNPASRQEIKVIKIISGDRKKLNIFKSFFYSILAKKGRK